MSRIAMRVFSRPQKLIDSLRWTILRLVLRSGKRTRLEGIRIVDVAGAADADSRLSKLDESLQLIGRFAPDYLERVRRDLREVVVFRGSGAQYHPGVGACFIDASWLVELPPAALAMVLVHEATHASLWREGVGYEPQERARIEELCVQAEIRFAEAIPGTDRLIAQARERLAHPWWSDAQLFSRRVENLRNSGCPKWYVAWYERSFGPAK